MATISLNYWAGARAAAGLASEEWQAGSIAEALALARLQRADPRFDRVLAASSILVDGHLAGPGDLIQPRDQAVTAEILPPFAGGAGSHRVWIPPGELDPFCRIQPAPKDPNADRTAADAAVLSWASH
jgi:sulfur-carrier protein